VKNNIKLQSSDGNLASADSVRECSVDSIRVVLEAGEYRLVAIRSIFAGEKLFLLEGEITPLPSRYSVQVGENQHVDKEANPSNEMGLDRFFWRFFNHSCDPNTVIRERTVFARRDIKPEEEITFNYNTTEWEMAEPFICHCGSVNCLQEIRGFKHLTVSQRLQLPMVAPHLYFLSNSLSINDV
jgi:hypothetical protein